MPKPYFKALVDNALGAIIGTCGERVRVVSKDRRYPPFDMSSVYDDNFKYIDPETENLVSSNEPAIGYRMSDTPKPLLAGDKVHVYSERLNYVVKNVIEDGQGGAVAQLHLEDDVNEQTT